MSSRGYQGGLDPVRVSHQVLDSLVNDFLIICVEKAPFERLDGFFILDLPLVVFALLAFVLLAVGSARSRRRFVGFGLLEVGGLPSTGEDTRHEAFEEGLDDVHHIRAEVPDHVELIQHGERAPVVYTSLVTWVVVLARESIVTVF